jgi:enoyl-CoA hydratase/carnithine racemase
MSKDSVLFEVRDNVAHVTLNRPQASNALDRKAVDGGGPPL